MKTPAAIMTNKLDQMVEAQKLWRSKNVQHYSYQYWETTGAPQDNFPWSVSVRNTIRATGKDAIRNTIPWANSYPYTMDELFDRIQAAFRENASFIEVRYHAIYGFPENIYIVVDDKVVDSTFHAEMYDFAAHIINP